MILAAGRGERMRPLTDTTPKPLLEVGGKPLVVWIIEALARAHFVELVMNVSHLGHRIEAALGDGGRWGVTIRYSHEADALETAGGIATAMPLLGTEPFAVVNGDIHTDYDFTSLRPIGAPQLMQRRVCYDINYVLRGDGGELTHAATLKSLKSGISMELWTTEPGVQFYDGRMLNIPVPGLAGVHYGPHAGLCLEPQRFPDGPNKAHFPPCILEPGAVSQQISELRFALA